MEWTGAVYADMPTVEVSTWVDAPPERVWELVCDIHAVAESSQELQRVEWADGDGPRLGARFTGYNRNAALGEWSTVSEVVEFEPLKVFGWAVTDPDNPTASWRLSQAPEGAGTRLTQWMQLGPAPSGLSLAITAMPDKEQKIVFVRLRELEAGMTATLAHLKRLAED
ncbi:SRPBCC family protein [[Mycobacterium] kokjensenii]|uniref:SRPBCC family protein n=1 Tax=[Mycobacterium] kokjensenii TaxID=3064287 RepID=A0ABN9NAV1_9MYCO|nr:SRPBCC family protein [Mycolicibacter sp. MU0083]CAJ1503386.1 SRPBCC family protein [Mycolicibacter sp. MU0083]